MVLRSCNRCQDPGRDVGNEAADEHARNNRQDHPDQANDCDVDIEIGGQTGAYAGDLAFVREAHESPLRRFGSDGSSAKAAI